MASVAGLVSVVAARALVKRYGSFEAVRGIAFGDERRLLIARANVLRRRLIS